MARQVLHFYGQGLVVALLRSLPPSILLSTGFVVSLWTHRTFYKLSPVNAPQPNDYDERALFLVHLLTGFAIGVCWVVAMSAPDLEYVMYVLVCPVDRRRDPWGVANTGR